MLYKSDIERIFVRLIFWDFDIPHKQLTKYLGVKPTEIRIKGEITLMGKKKREVVNKHNTWILSSELPHSVEPDRHLEEILDKVRPHKDKFTTMAKKYNAEISFAIYFNYCNPGLNLEPKLLKELADLGIEVGFDMYYLGENKEKPVIKEQP